MNLTASDIDRFHAKVDKTPGHGPQGECWVWTGGIRNGYGAFKLHGMTIDAHRVAFRVSGREQPHGMVVMHSCDFRPCCNPSHLKLGTNSDNMKDASQKGRLDRSTRTEPLTDDELKEICDEFDRGLSQKVLCRKWKIGPNALRRVLRKAGALAEA